MGSGEGGHRFAMAFETQAGLQFVGHELEVGRFLEGEELLEEGDGLRRPVGPMVAAGEPGGEVGAFAEEAGAQPLDSMKVLPSSNLALLEMAYL